MHLPYTDRYPEAIAIASQSLAASLTAVLWSRPLPKRAATLLFGASIWGSVLAQRLPVASKAFNLELPSAATWLAGSMLLATAAAALSGSAWFAGAALAGQFGLFVLGNWVRGSNDELMFAYLLWHGVLLGLHAVRSAPPRSREPAQPATRFPKQDLAIFCLTVVLATGVMTQVFEWVVYNGDEVANSFQADVYAHFKAYATYPPCRRSFENYWVFPYEGRLFSQYTPGWPLFMAPFQRFGAIALAGPFAAGILAVGVARLSRRVTAGLGASNERQAAITRVAGPLGAACVMLGPSVLLNGASRFSHTLVAACFAWAVESAAVLGTPGASRRRALGYGLLLGLATSGGLATRPADGGVLGVGVFIYFMSLLVRRRLSGAAFGGTCLGFAVLGGLTLVILRLQVGVWFHTGYHVTPLFHPEGELVLSLPTSSELKYGIPLATGSYCWWPIAPALGAAGLVRCLVGRERRVAFMLASGALSILCFYMLVAFGRGGDDGLGPRYIMPIVVTQAAGTAGVLAPLLAHLLAALRRQSGPARFRWKLAGPGLLMLAAALAGTWFIVPLTYPVAYQEHHAATAPLRAARAARLKNAIVLIEPNHIPAHETNLAQNAPMDPNPDVLFLIRRSAADDACFREHFPGRRWYRAGMTDKLEHVPAP